MQTNQTQQVKVLKSTVGIKMKIKHCYMANERVTTLNAGAYVSTWHGASNNNCIQIVSIHRVGYSSLMTNLARMDGACLSMAAAAWT